jgi:ribosomal protein S18 acetylase RimI-like enzyme
MKADTVKIRLMRVADFNAVVRIDEKVMKTSRAEYYKLKFEELVQSTDRLPTSLVAEGEDGTVVGFVMGALFIGEYGISRDATLDTIGVDPDYQDKGIGKLLMEEFMDHLKALGVRKVNTLVDSNDSKMSHFFRAHQFSPSQTINLERTLLS